VSVATLAVPKLQQPSRARLALVQRYSIVVLLVIVAAVFTVLTARFLTPSNLVTILLQASATAIAAIGMTFVITCAEIDISVGSLMSLAMTLAWLVSVEPGAAAGQAAPVGWVVYPAALLAGLALGLINGLIVNWLKINSLVATLATLNVYRGVALHLVGSSDKPSVGAVQGLARSETLGIGWPVYLGILVALVGAVVLYRTSPGRYIHAVGGSLRSAAETGLPAGRIRLLAFAVSGVCAALAGLVTVGRVGTLQAGLGVNFEFTVIAAVVLGGTSLFGGRGSVVGSILGAVLLSTIDNGLNLINASVYIYDVIRGVILIIAITMDLAFTQLGRSARMAAGVSGA
jgi:ribose transport system permease protein